MQKPAYIYFMTNKNHTTLYVGVTSNIAQRTNQHNTKATGGFSKKYNLDKLVYYELIDDISIAIEREKNIKNWKRIWKEELINKSNPTWQDLYSTLNN